MVTACSPVVDTAGSVNVTSPSAAAEVTTAAASADDGTAIGSSTTTTSTTDPPVPEYQVWDGPVPHLFTHSLIVRPELAFDGDYQEQGYRDHMITTGEFTRILEQMHAGGWALIDVHQLYDVVDGRSVEPAELEVPAGKKPFVLSIDDVSYYSYMDGNGFADRLEVGPDGRIRTVVIEDGTEQSTLDGDVVPIVESFIEDHPDFSIDGARGILALTGYEGALGYDISRDQVDDPDYAVRMAAAIEVADALKADGWRFASHSYTHHGDMRDGTMSMRRFSFDTSNWSREIGIVVGPTELFISPFGFHLPADHRYMRHLVEQGGYKAYFPIGGGGVTSDFRGDHVVFERLSVDGYTLRERPEALAPYFDAAAVWDPARGAYPSQEAGRSGFNP